MNVHSSYILPSQESLQQKKKKLSVRVEKIACVCNRILCSQSKTLKKDVKFQILHAKKNKLYICNETTFIQTKPLQNSKLKSANLLLGRAPLTPDLANPNPHISLLYAHQSPTDNRSGKTEPIFHSLGVISSLMAHQSIVGL